MLVHGKICGYDFGRVGIFFFFFLVHGNLGTFFFLFFFFGAWSCRIFFFFFLMATLKM